MMSVAYAYESDANSIMTQSGRPYSVLQQLRRQGCSVLPAFPLRTVMRYLYAPKAVYYRARRLTYRPDREPQFLKSLARQIERRLRGKAMDCIFAPGSHAIAELAVPQPKIFCADATFANVLDFYTDFSACAPEFVALGHNQERKALANCTAAIYPSEWAANSACQDYGAEPAKIHVIPFGANVVDHGPEVVHDWIIARGFDRLRILFIGRDWERKGGDTVLEACQILRAEGVPVQLDLVGIEHCPVPVPAHVKLHGLLDKRNPDHQATLSRLLARAHFFFVPSRAENYGMAFCEAAAFGVPSLSAAVGGIPTIIRHGVSGYVFPPDSPAEAYAEAALQSFTDRNRYRELAHASYREFSDRLNWDAFGRALVRVMESTR